MQYKKTTLKNGVKLITVPTKDHPSVTVMVLVETGSNYESKAENGLSHFLEHMMFKGTEKRPSSMAIARELDSLGAQNNAFTSNEMTGYWAKAERKHFAKIFEIIADLYLNPVLPAPELEKERGVILQEISMYEDLPQHKVWDVFGELLYGDVPAGRTILGPAKNIKKFKRGDFLRYRRTHYVAEKTIVVVVGDVNENEVEALAEKEFAPIKKSSRKGKPKVSSKQKSPQIKIFRKKTDQTHLVLGFRTFSANDTRRAALAVLVGVLGRGMSSRLFQKLREELGICYYVRAGDDEFTDHGYVAVSSGLDNKRIEIGLEAIVKELRRLKEETISPEELAKSKDYIIGNMYMGLETTDALAGFYADQEITKEGKVSLPKEIEEEIRKVTAEEIQSLAKELFVEKNANLAIVGQPKSESRLRKLLVLS